MQKIFKQLKSISSLLAMVTRVLGEIALIYHIIFYNVRLGKLLLEVPTLLATVND